MINPFYFPFRRVEIARSSPDLPGYVVAFMDAAGQRSHERGCETYAEALAEAYGLATELGTGIRNRIPDAERPRIVIEVGTATKTAFETEGRTRETRHPAEMRFFVSLWEVEFGKTVLSDHADLCSAREAAREAATQFSATFALHVTEL